MLGILLAAKTSGQLGSMFVFFLIALVLVSPFGYRRIRSTLRERREALGIERAGHEEQVVAAPTGGPPRPANDLSHVVDAISAARGDLRADPGATRSVDVPAEPLVEGRPASPVVVEALIDDAVRRSGLRSEWLGEGDARRLVLRADGT